MPPQNDARDAPLFNMFQVIKPFKDLVSFFKTIILKTETDTLAMNFS